MENDGADAWAREQMEGPLGGRPAVEYGREDGIFFSSSFFLVVEIKLHVDMRGLACR
jgi:hypothetical protein